MEKIRERNCPGGRNAGGELFEVGKRGKGLSGMGKDGRELSGVAKMKGG